MKKTLAIVLALVMVLCMIPAMSAAKTIGGKSYNIAITSVNLNGKEGTYSINKNVTAKNSMDVTYDYEKLAADLTGKFTEDAKMALVTVTGFDSEIGANPEIYINGSKLQNDAIVNNYGVNPWKDNNAGEVNTSAVTFPVELTKAGYSASYTITVTDGKVEENAVISLKLQNSASYKASKTATVTDIAAVTKTKAFQAYIVGDKIYIDSTGEATKWDAFTDYIKVTFADEEGKPFTAVTWAYQPADGKIGFLTADGAVLDAASGQYGMKLKDSAVKYVFSPAKVNNEKIKFKLETANAFYTTKEFTIVVRDNIKEADPKGIYFAEAAATIKVGETFTPVVYGVATGRKITPDALAIGKGADKNIIDIDGAKIIGTREGVTYITAEYKPAGGTEDQKYVSSSMKIVVTEGESIPPAVPTTTTYVVSCRNLNVRKGAGTSYAKAGMIHRGDAVEVVEIANGWAKLANGTYVCAKYIYKK